MTPPTAPKLPLFRIETLECGETETVFQRGHDASDAAERFWDRMADYGGTQGIEILSVSRYYSPAEQIARKFERSRTKNTHAA